MTKRNGGKKGSTNRIKGFGYVGSIAQSSNLGALVVDRYEIDTSLTAVWAQFGNLFQKWKIHRLVFELVPIQGITETGMVLMGIIEDPDSTTPSAIGNFADQRIVRAFRYASATERMTLRYDPPSSWLFTRDGGISDDRFEMPGDLIIGSANFSQAITPGQLFVHYDIEFAEVTNSVVSVPQPVKKFKAPIKEEASQEQVLIDEDDPKYRRLLQKMLVSASKQ